MGRQKEIIEIFCVTILFAIVAAFINRQLLPFRHGDLLAYRDQLLHAWILAHDMQYVFTDPLNIFDAKINFPAPYTLALSDHLFGLLPIFAVAYLFTCDYVAAHNCTFLICGIISAFAAYVYFRDKKINIANSIAASLFFSFGIFYDLIEEIQLSLFGIVFLVFLFIDKYLATKNKKYLFFVLGFYLWGLATGFYFSVMASIAIAAYLCAGFIFDRKIIPAKEFIHVSLSLCAAPVIALPTLYPYISLKLEGVLKNADLLFIARESNPITNPYLIIWFVFSAASGIYLLKKSHKESRAIIAAFSAISILFLALSMGPFVKVYDKTTTIPTIYHLFRVLPGFGAIRFPWRFYLMAHAAIAFMFAVLLHRFGEDAETAKNKIGKTARYTAIFFIYAIIVSIVFEPRERESVRINGALDLPLFYQTLAATDKGGAVAEFPLTPAMKSTVFIYQYFSLYHGHPIFNGNSGYTPPGHGILFDTQYSAEEWVKILRALGVKYIASHDPDFTARVIEEAWVERVEKNADRPVPPYLSINPIDRAIALNALIATDANRLAFLLHINPVNAVIDEKADRNIFLFKLPPAGKYGANLPPELTGFATLANGRLHLEYKNLPQINGWLAKNNISILSASGIDEIEVGDYRRLFYENCHNPFYAIKDETATALGLVKIARGLWEISATEKNNISQYPIVEFTGGDTVKISIRAPSETVWVNPNPFGVNKAIIKTGSHKKEIEFYLPLAITDISEFRTSLKLPDFTERPITIELPELRASFTAD